MVKLKGLGRGLDAMLAGDMETVSANDTPNTLSVSQLQPGKYQPRTHMDQALLASLADSIRAQGIMQPILVRRVVDDKYEIIAGERRWLASQLAGLSEVPVLVREIPDESALAMALIENIQRENLNPLEEAHGIQRLINEFDMVHQAAADAVGRSRSVVTNLLRLQNLNKNVQEMLMQGQLDMGHARAILSLSEAKQIMEPSRLPKSSFLSGRQKAGQAIECRTPAKGAQGGGSGCAAPAGRSIGIAGRDGRDPGRKQWQERGQDPLRKFGSTGCAD